jgi:hypothetical protein
VAKLWLHVSSNQEIRYWHITKFQFIVVACAAAGKVPPPGWTESDESGRAVSLSDVSRRGKSMALDNIKSFYVLT